MSAHAIEAEDLVKRYGAHTAVDHLSFTVGYGEVFGLLGPNGAGKTTTVEMIEGLRRPDAGTVRVLGQAQGPGADAIKARLGVQLQNTGLFPRLTVREMIDLFATFFPRSLPTDYLLDLAGLGEKARTATAALSGGQRQRLTLALALVGDPDVLFLDEPTAAMDPQGRRGVWDMIAGLRASGKTVVLTTHYMEEAARLCDRVAVIDRGRIIAEGQPAALVRQHFAESAVEFATPAAPLDVLKELPHVSRVLVENGSTTLYTARVPETVTGLMDLSRRAGFQLDGFTVRNATLEDVFLRLTGRRIRN